MAMATLLITGHGHKISAPPRKGTLEDLCQSGEPRAQGSSPDMSISFPNSHSFFYPQAGCLTRNALPSSHRFPAQPVSPRSDVFDAPRVCLNGHALSSLPRLAVREPRLLGAGECPARQKKSGAFSPCSRTEQREQTSQGDFRSSRAMTLGRIQRCDRNSSPRECSPELRLGLLPQPKPRQNRGACRF